MTMPKEPIDTVHPDGNAKDQRIYWKADHIAGQISASLTSLSRTVDDYSETSKKELITAKQEKAYERIKNFRTELLDYRKTFDLLKKDREDSVCTFTQLVLPHT